MNRTINDAGLNLIKRFEGCELKAYKCPAGLWTIGYGHTGPDVRRDMKITQREANELLDGDILHFESAVNAMVKVPLTDNQFAALVSFAFNLGDGALASSTLLKHVNAGRFAMAADEFLKWVHIGKVVSEGLKRRRAAERELFLKGV